MSVFELLKHSSIEVPALCFDQRVHPISVCRLCLVKVKGIDDLIPSCRTLLADRMEIDTHTPEIESYRRQILQLLAKNYPAIEITKQPQKEFHKWLLHYEINPEGENHALTIDDSHPYIRVDMSRCINCFRCVNICDHLQGQFVWHIVNRGDQINIISDSNDNFAQSSCVGCGACADTCPTGAIEDKQAVTYGLPDQTTRSVCAYCGVGCEMEISVNNNRIAGIHPTVNAPVNKGHLCVKGRYAWEYVYATDRVTAPMIRRQDQWETVSWKTAIDYCVQKLTAIRNNFGADSLGIIGSARATNEDNYLIQKFGRVVLGTNNVDNCARVCHQPTAKAMNMTLGTGASTNCFDDIEKARTILIAGANPSESHPVIGARIKQAVLNGANLIIIDPRKTELAEYATLFLPIKPGTNIPLFNALANVIVTENLCDTTFINSRTQGWEVLNDFIRVWTPERAARICRIQPELIRDTARLFAKGSPSMCFHGLGLTEHTQGTENVITLVNLVLLTGNICKPGTGINPLRGQNNVQGSAAMGCDPSVYTGMAPVREDRERFEQLWNCRLPAGKGLNLPEMLDAAVAGSLKAMWIIGYDVYFTMPDANRSLNAFKNLDFLIVQDMFLNETAARFADVFLPCTSSFEKDGTFMNAERRIQRVRKAIPSPPTVKPDWEIVCDMAAAMGEAEKFSYGSAREIWDEIRSTWQSVYGITYDRLNDGGIQWPCPAPDHPGTPILHTETFPTENGKARLSVIDFIPGPEQTDAAYPYILITGRELYHFNAGTMTFRTFNKDLSFGDLVHLNPEDAEVLGMKNGDRCRLISRYGEAGLKVLIDAAMNKGEVFTTFSNSQVFVNKVTGPYRDRFVQTPEYKITAIRIEKE